MLRVRAQITVFSIWVLAEQPQERWAMIPDIFFYTLSHYSVMFGNSMCPSLTVRIGKYIQLYMCMSTCVCVCALCVCEWMCVSVCIHQCMCKPCPCKCVHACVYDMYDSACITVYMCVFICMYACTCVYFTWIIFRLGKAPHYD